MLQRAVSQRFARVIDDARGLTPFEPGFDLDIRCGWGELVEFANGWFWPMTPHVSCGTASTRFETVLRNACRRNDFDYTRILVVRNVPPFSCPQCGDMPLAGNTCTRCGVELLDAEGTPLLAPRLWQDLLQASSAGEWRWHLFGAAVLMFGASLGCDSIGAAAMSGLLLLGAVALAGLCGASFYRLHQAEKTRSRPEDAQQRREARIKAVLEHAGSVQPIATAQGLCRIRGTVHVIRPTSLQASLSAGAVLRCRRRYINTRYERVSRDDEIHPARTIVDYYDVSYLEQEEECGRFAVIDDTGLAIVDDDAFDIVGRGGKAPSGEALLAALAGTVVEVAGPTKRVDAPDVAHLARAEGYRGANRQPLMFDGNAENRVVILAPTHDFEWPWRAGTP